MKILIAALLSAGLITLTNGQQTPANLNNSITDIAAEQSAAVTAKAGQVQRQDKAKVANQAPEYTSPNVIEPEQATVVTPEPVVAETPPVTAASGSCEAEIAKYNWSYTVALAVARAESGLDPGQVNNTPATGDYSVGCFQVNIYGANAYSRPSEAQLKDAATNVAWAYKIYASNGHSFIGQWGVCRNKVACY